MSLSSPFGDSEFQEEEIHDTHYEQETLATPTVVDTSLSSSNSSSGAGSSSSASSGNGASILSHYAQTADIPVPTSSSSSSSSSSSASRSSDDSEESLPTSLSSLRVTNGTRDTTTTYLPPDLTEQFEVGKRELAQLWETISLPDPSAFTHACFANDRYFGSFKVSVVDPERRGDNLNSYVVYKVVSSIEYSPSSPTENTVVRRYSDFAWLHEQLSYAIQYGGFMIPALPDKAVIGRFGEDFVEDRRRGLELFLRKLLSHPQLRHSEDIRLFLSASDAAFAAARQRKRGPTIQQPDAPATTSNAVMSFFKDRVQGLANQIAGQREFERTPDDVACEKAFNYSKHLEESLARLNEHTEQLLKRERNVARSWVEVGIAASMLAQFEAESGEKLGSQSLGAIGTRCDQIAIVTAQKVELERQGFRDILKDHIRHAEAAQEMLRIRNIVNHNYHQAQLALEARQNKQNVKDQAQQARLIAEAQQNLNSRQRELTEATARARVEFARFNKERQRALKEAIKHFVKLQVEHTKRTQELWESVLPDLEKL